MSSAGRPNRIRTPQPLLRQALAEIAKESIVRSCRINLTMPAPGHRSLDVQVSEVHKAGVTLAPLSEAKCRFVSVLFAFCWCVGRVSARSRRVIVLPQMRAGHP